MVVSDAAYAAKNYLGLAKTMTGKFLCGCESDVVRVPQQTKLLTPMDRKFIVNYPTDACGDWVGVMLKRDRDGAQARLAQDLAAQQSVVTLFHGASAHDKGAIENIAEDGLKPAGAQVFDPTTREVKTIKIRPDHYQQPFYQVNPATGKQEETDPLRVFGSVSFPYATGYAQSVRIPHPRVGGETLLAQIVFAFDVDEEILMHRPGTLAAHLAAKCPCSDVPEEVKESSFGPGVKVLPKVAWVLLREDDAGANSEGTAMDWHE